MRSSLVRTVRRSVRAGGNMVSQIVVSVAAAVCVGFITSAYFEEPRSAAAAPDAVESVGVAGLPPLPTETIADRPVHGAALPPEGAEIFPGVPADSALAASARALPADEERGRRRLLGLPLPYTPPTPGDVVSTAVTDDITAVR